MVAGYRGVCLPVIERELFSQALAWVAGELLWQASFEGDVDDRPSVGVQVPFDPGAV